MPSLSYWNNTARPIQFPPLSSDIRVDAAVIGGGNTGILAAYLMKRAGLSVALLERDRCAEADTGHTTAHLTYVTDLRLGKLVSRFGRAQAQAVWEAGEVAIQQIERIIERESIECNFARVPGYLHASISDDRDEQGELQREADLANELGFSATYVDSVPVFHRPGIRFPTQARFHPTKFLAGLLQRIPGPESYIFEQTEVTRFEDNGRELSANGYTVTCGFVFIATDVPLQGRANLASATLLQSKIAPYTSYAIGARLTGTPVPDALFWDTSDPYFFLRIDPHEDGQYAVFGGMDHKTGQGNAKESFKRLEDVFRRIFPEAQAEHRWSGQVIESIDGLPFIGETAERQFVATGFSGNGLTFGTVGAMMACDAAWGRKNRWQALFDVRRKSLSSIWNYVRQNADYPYYLIKDRLVKSDDGSREDLAPGQGKIVRINGQRVAVFRNAAGEFIELSPVCTHLGCLVNWNEAERTWDCPCHGSRFLGSGEVFAGPAEKPLAPIEKNHEPVTTAPRGEADSW
jgi:glycine/D-amino acid oxidase-like deaminating enzyme/nitrite reductase/ring-hydroxylating ferredoxin subunit